MLIDTPSLTLRSFLISHHVDLDKIEYGNVYNMVSYNIICVL